MTDNMELMYEDLMGALFTCVPIDHVDYLFSDMYPLDPREYIDYIMLEFVRHAYYESMEKHPLRYYIPYDVESDHSERMRYSRILKYTQKFKTYNYKLLLEEANGDSEKIKKYESLLGKDMSNMNNRIEGYELSEMTFFEHTTILELAIIKAIVEK